MKANKDGGPKSVKATTGPPSQEIVIAANAFPPHLPLIPLPSRPLFPKTVTPLIISERPLIELIETALKSQERIIGLVLCRSKSLASGETSRSAPQAIATTKPEDLHRVGVVAQIIKAQKIPNTSHMQLLAGGIERIAIRQVLIQEPHMIAEVEYLKDVPVDTDGEVRAYALAVINSVRDLIELNPLFKQELNLLLQQGSIEEPGRLADYAAYLTSAKGGELQKVLETLKVKPRLELVLELLRKEIDISKLQFDIRKQIEERVSKQQREFFLREQLKAIKHELGLEKDDKEADLSRFLERLEARSPTDEAQTRIDEEVDKLRMLEPASPEYNVTRNYLDWLTSLPWGVTSTAKVTLRHARAVLDDGHYGLDDVKDRILEHIAAGLLKGSFSGSIIVLVGPPGVGKTSIGRSIAEALRRPFYRFSLGGMRDEAEIKGHRRTYVGAMPGKFVQAMRTCKTADPVIMLDEIDKIGASFRGDPASALLEALDPEQNVDFLDHYLDVRFDLSKVLFVCTANQLDTIPGPLLDRMELIKLSGYLVDEKVEIARRHLVPRQLDAHGLNTRRLTITKAALKELAEGYARDAGVRTLEKLIMKLVRKCAVKLLNPRSKRISIGPAEVHKFLGRRVFRDDDRRGRPQPGVIVGLAWTSMGGDTLIIEATALRSERGGLKQTGQLGSVMVESSEIAYTFARKLCQDSRRCADFFGKHLIHLHVPAGATPKDGPSAGITMASALYSLATGKSIKAGWAMTGELNLTGQVMPVGGIKEKIIAARRAKLRNVILPAANERDYETLPASVKAKLTVHFASTFEDVMDLCL